MKKRMLVTSLLCALCFIFTAFVSPAKYVYAASPVPIDETNFPNETFRNYVKDTFDTAPDGGDGYLSDEEIADVTEIDVSYTGENMNLEGLKFFTELRFLYCDGIGLTNLDISSNTKLTDLSCNENGNLTAIDFHSNTALRNVFADNCGFKEINTDDNPELVRLMCNGNSELASLNFDKNKKLYALSCEYTAIDKLDLNNNPDIFEIYISGTKVKSVDTTKLPELSQLAVKDTDISSLDLSKNPKMALLYLSNSKITNLNFEQTPNLAELYINDCGFTSLKTQNLPNLKTVECARTPLKSLDFSKNSNLQGLDCSKSDVTQINLNGCTKMYRLELADTAVSTLDISRSRNLNSLTINDTNIANLKKLDLSSTPNLVTLNANNAGIESITGIPSSLSQLEVNKNHLKELDLTGLGLWDVPFTDDDVQTVSMKAVKNGDSYTVDMKKEISDIARLTVADAEGSGGDYSYDSSTGILTIKSALPLTFDYTYAHNYTSSYPEGLKDNPLKVKATVTYEETPAVSKDVKKYKNCTSKVKLSTKKLRKAVKITASVSKANRYNKTGFKIYKYNTKTKKYSPVKTIKTSKTSASYTQRKLKKGKKYYYAVRTYKVVDGKNVYGKMSKRVAIRAK